MAPARGPSLVGSITWAKLGGVREPCRGTIAGHGGCFALFVLVCCQRHLCSSRLCGAETGGTTVELCPAPTWHSLRSALS